MKQEIILLQGNKREIETRLKELGINNFIDTKRKVEDELFEYSIIRTSLVEDIINKDSFLSKNKC